MKNILVVFNSFKQSLTNMQINAIVSDRIKNLDNNLTIKTLPLADGGDNTLSSLFAFLTFKKVVKFVHNSYGEKIKTYYLIKDDEAYIECANIIGFSKAKKHALTIMDSSSFGVGELIKDCLNKGIYKINIFVGGTLTNDGGIGLLAALGAKIYDKDGVNCLTSGKLNEIVKIDLSELHKGLSMAKFVVGTDCNNVLIGKNGATRVYGAQKGANSFEIEKLESGIKHYDKLMKSITNLDYSNTPKIGAGGGIIYSLINVSNVTLGAGFDILNNFFHYADEIENADLIITGEGKIDNTTFMGKCVGNIIKICKEKNKTVIVIGAVNEYAYQENMYEFGLKDNKILSAIKTKQKLIQIIDSIFN